MLPVPAVERQHFERAQIDPVEAADIDVDFVGIRARHVERMNAASRAKGMFCRAGVEPIGGERVLAADKLELLRRHNQMQKAFFATDRAVAVGDPRQVRCHAKAHAATMTTAFKGLQRHTDSLSCTFFT